MYDTYRYIHIHIYRYIFITVVMWDTCYIMLLLINWDHHPLNRRAELQVWSSHLFKESFLMCFSIFLTLLFVDVQLRRFPKKNMAKFHGWKPIDHHWSPILRMSFGYDFGNLQTPPWSAPGYAGLKVFQAQSPLPFLCHCPGLWRHAAKFHEVSRQQFAN